MLFSIVAAPIYILNNSYCGSLFSTSLPFVVYRLSDGSRFDRCEVISPCGFELQFFDN